MFSVKDILTATQGILLKGKDSILCKGVSIDSRTLKKGELFIAIKGKNVDGHKFIISAIAKKASAVVFSQQRLSSKISCSAIWVKDTTQALGDIALFHRRRFSLPVVAVTGSAGKTTTKDLISHVLKKKFHILTNFGSYNNLIGVPLTLLQLNRQHEILVVELGTSFPGEIKRLTEVSQPSVVVFTNIGESHIEFLKSPAYVYREKVTCAEKMLSKGTIIYNKDDRFLRKISQRKLKRRLIPFSVQAQCAYRAKEIWFKENLLYFTLPDNRTFMLRTPYFHNVYNGLAAISCARLFNIPFKTIQRTFVDFRFPKGRGILKKCGPYWFIDDSYNSNPLSLKSAIATLESLNFSGRKILVCGDMLELGKHAQRLHAKIGAYIAKTQIDILLTVGRHSKFIVEKAKKNKNLLAVHCSTLKIVEGWLKKYLKPKDIILIKGSRAIHLEKVIAFLEKR